MSDTNSEDEEAGPSVSMTGFLFGNVDTKTGKLENQSIFGLDSEKQLKALENFGLGFQTVFGDEDEEGEARPTNSNTGKLMNWII